MYTLVKADVLLVAGELAALDDPRFAFAIELAQLVVANVGDCTAWGNCERAKKAATYAAAHFAKLELQATVATGTAPSVGPLSQVTVGPLSKSYATMGVSLREAINASWSLTGYGTTYMTLARLFSFARGFVT